MAAEEGGEGARNPTTLEDPEGLADQAAPLIHQGLADNQGTVARSGVREAPQVLGERAVPAGLFSSAILERGAEAQEVDSTC